LPQLREALLEATQGYDKITARGFSMGGYGALLLSRALRLNRVLLVSPQVSVFPDHAPWETRYLVEAAQLDPAWDDLARKPRRGLHGVVLYDPMDAVDRQHAAAIGKLFPRLSMVPLAFGGHPATRVLLEGWKFSKLQQELLRPRLRPGFLLRGHKIARRNSPSYRAALQNRCEARGKRS